jgi:hypothetical protein
MSQIEAFQREMTRRGYSPMSGESADEYVRDRVSYSRPRVYVKVSDFGGGYFRKPFRRKGRGWCVCLSGTARLTSPMVRDIGDGLLDVVFFGDYSS